MKPTAPLNIILSITFTLAVFMAAPVQADSAQEAGLPGVNKGMDLWRIQAALARGGRLYDKWYKVADVTPPQVAHPAYPRAGKYYKKPAATWRCKECHGWDYMGAEGAYSSGKHRTGIIGIRNMREAPVATIVAVLKNGTHRFAGKMVEADLQDLALFVSKGQLDMDSYIDRVTGQAVGGNALRGEAYYQTLCARCHGPKGLRPKEMKPLGKQMEGNPWEVFHKILNGQPAEEMPALRALGIRMPPPWGSRKLMVPLDIMAYLKTLPKSR